MFFKYLTQFLPCAFKPLSDNTLTLPQVGSYLTYRQSGNILQVQHLRVYLRKRADSINYLFIAFVCFAQVFKGCFFLVKRKLCLVLLGFFFIVLFHALFKVFLKGLVFFVLLKGSIVLADLGMG